MTKNGWFAWSEFGLPVYAGSVKFALAWEMDLWRWISQRVPEMDLWR